jgi:hypothetical protein
VSSSPLDDVEADLRNIAVVLDADKGICDQLRWAIRLGGRTNEEIVMLRISVARFANTVAENGWKILGLAE